MYCHSNQLGLPRVGTRSYRLQTQFPGLTPHISDASNCRICVSGRQAVSSFHTSALVYELVRMVHTSQETKTKVWREESQSSHALTSHPASTAKSSATRDPLISILLSLHGNFIGNLRLEK